MGRKRLPFEQRGGGGSLKLGFCSPHGNGEGRTYEKLLHLGQAVISIQKKRGGPKKSVYADLGGNNP